SRDGRELGRYVSSSTFPARFGAVACIVGQLCRDRLTGSRFFGKWKRSSMPRPAYLVGADEDGLISRAVGQSHIRVASGRPVAPNHINNFADIERLRSPRGVVCMKAWTLALFSLGSTFAGERATVTGIVTDAAGKPVEHVSVLIYSAGVRKG